MKKQRNESTQKKNKWKSYRKYLCLLGLLQGSFVALPLEIHSASFWDVCAAAYNYLSGNEVDANESNLSGKTFSQNEFPPCLPKPLTFADQLKRSPAFFLDPLPIVDWINTANLGSFFQSNMKEVLCNENYFSNMDSLDQFSVWVQPFGLHSKFNQKKTSFQLDTFGVSLGGGYTVIDRLIAGIGIGGLHSELTWQQKFSDTHINSLYFGPYLGYIFDRAYVALTLLGKWNSYNVERSVQFEERKQKTHNEHNGWNINTRVEGGMDFKLYNCYVEDFIIQPNVTLDYLNVFDGSYEEFAHEKKIFSVADRHSSFFRSRLAVQAKKEFFNEQIGFIFPSISFGWVCMQPISNNSISFEVSENCSLSNEITEKVSSDYEGSNQLFLGVSLVGIHRRGILAALGFEANIGNPYAVYVGNFRLEFDW